MKFIYVFIMTFALSTAVLAYEAKKIAVIVQRQIPHGGVTEIEKTMLQILQEKQHHLYRDNIVFKSFSWQGDFKKIPNLVQQVLGQYQPDLIICFAATAAKEFSLHTSSIPIVFAIIGNPVEHGLIDEPGKPKNNLTGFTDYEYLYTSMVQLMQTLFIGKPMQKIVVLYSNPIAKDNLLEYTKYIQDDYLHTFGSGRSSISVEFMQIADSETVESLNSRILSRSADGVLFYKDNDVTIHMERMVNYSKNLKVPSIMHFQGMAQRGALLHYDSILDKYESVLIEYIAKILFQNIKPNALKVLGPNTYDIAVNETTAKKHGWVLDTKKVPGIRVVK